ncbi:DUF6503 family protein [Flagellimonas myxillae]|uniref:DUF6503 family protein n=1 Tax=Flagellimonas myxillae TaxID=2942214 RepID=UPI00201E9B03|nr:DUF6503 family protein [Muricauda myxillae]MCL6265366.1 DUF4292 domain-containing protein [Muricauda myxillae]
MKKTTILALILIIASCKPESKKEESKTIEPTVETRQVRNYPKLLADIFTAHGGLDAWKSQRTLTFELPMEDAKEKHTIDLRSRKDRVDTEQISMGSDGKAVWLMDTEGQYKGDAVFYHNLMFYFYAMPFVLADDGIVYHETENLVYAEKSYPGIRIAYETGVGTSPKDEYFIHVDPETGKMAWLGYTVTYRTGESSDNVKWIRYDNWQTVEDLVLPKSITWYNYEGPKILDARSTVNFENVALSKDAKSGEFYAKPEKAVVVEPKNKG